MSEQPVPGVFTAIEMNVATPRDIRGDRESARCRLYEHDKRWHFQLKTPFSLTHYITFRFMAYITPPPRREYHTLSHRAYIFFAATAAAMAAAATISPPPIRHAAAALFSPLYYADTEISLNEENECQKIHREYESRAREIIITLPPRQEEKPPSLCFFADVTIESEEFSDGARREKPLRWILRATMREMRMKEREPTIVWGTSLR